MSEVALVQLEWSSGRPNSPFDFRIAELLDVHRRVLLNQQVSND
jgi:hypothetical protein